MEHNTDRILWTVLVLAIGVALYVGFKGPVNGLLGQVTEKIQTVATNVHNNTSDSSNTNSNNSGSSSNTAVGTNLATGTDQEYTMGYGILNTTWEDGYAYEKLPTTIMRNGEILPQDPHTFWYTLTKGTTYTQTIWFETDANVKNLNAADITWWTTTGHDIQPATLVKLGKNKYKLYSTYTWPGKSDNNVRLFDTYRLDCTFDLNTGTYLKFDKLKLEKGNVSTPWVP